MRTISPIFIDLDLTLIKYSSQTILIILSIAIPSSKDYLY